LRRNCLLKYVIERKKEGRIDVMGMQGRRCKQLLDDVKEKRGYWKLKEETLDRILWGTCLARGYGTVVRQTAVSVNDVCTILGYFAGSCGNCYKTKTALNSSPLLCINITSSKKILSDSTAKQNINFSHVTVLVILVYVVVLH
jgi:hypothetical protein